MACTETYYIESATSLKNRLTRICNIIEALEQRIIDVAVGNADVEGYSLDDGQVKIQTKYRSLESLEQAIQSFERLKQKLLNQLNGRQTVLRDNKGLRYGRNFR